MSGQAPEIIVVVGPTAAGKSELAVGICQALGGAVVSADSRQVYKGLDIGTAKLGSAERGGIDHHLIDIRDIGHAYSLFEFLADANAAITAIRARGQRPVIAGGTALYVHALIAGFAPGASDPIRRAHLEERMQQSGLGDLVADLMSFDAKYWRGVDLANPRRVVRALERAHSADLPTQKFPCHRALVLGIAPPAALRRERIIDRAHAMFNAGLTDETRRLLYSHGPSRQLIATIGYRQCLEYLLGRYDQQAAREKTIVATNRYARRQMTYLRNKMKIEWLTDAEPSLRQALRLTTHNP